MKQKNIFNRLPKKVRIGRRNYKVKNKVSVEGLDGQIIDWSRTIEAGGEDPQSTFIHEILHGLDWQKKIGLTEKQVLKLEAAIVGLFRANGWKIKR